MNRSANVTCSGTGMLLAEQFRAIAEIRGDVAWVLDCATGLPTYLSPAIESVLGYGAAEVEAQLAGGGNDSPLAALCAGLPERLRRFTAGEHSRKRLVREFDLRRPDGAVVPLEVISTLLTDASGAPAALVGIVRDISARRERDAAQRRFASMLNHEFRTPLSTIDGAIQRLEVTGANADEATRRRYRNIGVAVERLIGMLDEYLSPERMAAIGRQRQPEHLSPRQLLDEGAALARAAGRAATIEAGELPAALRCAPDGLRLALGVLVKNAVQHSAPDSVIAFAGGRADGGIELLVRDQGRGVPADEAERIFDKFYRGRNASHLPGSGLGLYMARSVVDVHGGTVTLRNAKNGGAEFRIWLPAQDGAGKKVASDAGSSDNLSINQQGQALGWTNVEPGVKQQ